MTINWPLVGHVVVGTVITGSQAVALADPNPQVVSICHIVALLAANIGASLGVWQVSSNMATKRMMAAPCANCGKLASEGPKLDGLYEALKAEPPKDAPKAV